MPDHTTDASDEAQHPRRDIGRPGGDRIRFLGESYRILFQRNPLPMWIYDVKSLRFLDVNEAAVGHYGYSREEFLSMTIRDIRPHEDIPALEREVAQLNSGTQSFGVWRHLSRDGSLIDVNESFLRAFEYERREVIGTTSIELGMWAVPADREHVLTPVRAGKSVRGTEATFRSKSGRTWNALVFSEPITLEAEPSILSSHVDVTDLRAAQQRILEMERLSSIGQTAALVAHEINTPLTNIALLASNIRRQTEDPAILQRAEKIETQRKVASRIIDEVLTLSRSFEIRREGTDLNALVRADAEQADTYRKPEVALNLDLPEGPIAAWVDPLRMAQVFVNLIKNALQATDHGTVAVSMRTEGRTAVVVVEDTGPGMTEEIQARLFQPFFTTKAHGEGVGLGLVFVRSVVNAHGGTLELASEPGKGTTCTLRLPVDAPAR